MPDIVPVDHDPFEGADPFEMAAAQVRSRYPTRPASSEAMAASQGNVGFGDVLASKAQSIASLPQRATRAAGELQRTGDAYDPVPAIETAGLMAGSRFPTVGTGELGMFGGRLGPSTPETISAAATRYNGKVYRGTHHGETVELAAKDAGKSVDEVADNLLLSDDGFVTSSGRFVDRQEAAKIAANNGQIKLFSRIMQPVKRLMLGKHGQGNPLMSEELKPQLVPVDHQPEF